MKGSRIRDSLEIIGLFGVIASLLFVGLELRQAQQIAISSSNQARTETTVQLLTTLATDPVLRSAMLKSNSGIEGEWTPEENLAMIQMGNATLFHYENIHYQYLNGFIPPERWQGTRVNLAGNLAAPSYRLVYERNPEAWSPQFQELVDEIIAADQ